MINRFAKIITNWLIKNDAIVSEDRELYEYATSNILFAISPILIVIVFSGFLGLLKECIFLIIPFICIRKFSGGYHAKTPTLCFIYSTCFLSFILLLASINNNVIICNIILLISIFIILLLSPIESESKPLNNKEKILYKKISGFIIFFFSSIYFVLLWLNLFSYGKYIVFGLLLTAGLQLPCIPTIIQKNSNSHQ